MRYLSKIDKSEIRNKRVLLRVDLNVPVSNGRVSDYNRIELVIPTIRYLKSLNAKIILISHFGRPKGEHDPSLSLKFLTTELSKILSTDVKFANLDNFVVKNLKEGEILLLENIRFYKGEISNNTEFAEKISSLGDVYINDAFSCSHREHASISGVTRFLPSYAGFLLENELNSLDKFFDKEASPSVAIIGGKKVSTKLAILDNLSKKMDYLIICGAMANTFLKAQNYEIGVSFFEPNLLQKALDIISKSKSKIILPTDFLAPEKESDTEIKFLELGKVGKKDNLLDIGPKSCLKICSIIEKAKIVLWNGPLGMFEDERFALSTKFISSYMASATAKGDLTSIIGGGDTVCAISNSPFKQYFSHISSAGGAFLEWLEGKQLHGIKALLECAKN